MAVETIAEPRVRRWVAPHGAGTLRRSTGPLAEAQWAWIDVEAPTPASLVLLADGLGVPEMALEDALEHDIFPKAEDGGEVIVAVFHFPFSTGDDDRLDTFPLLCVLSDRLLLTAHHPPAPGLDWLVEAAEHQPAAATGGPDRMLARLADVASREYLPLLAAVESQLDDLEDRAVEGDPQSLGDAHALRRDAVMLRGVLGPQRDAIGVLRAVDNPLLGERARARLSDVHERMVRLVESLDAARLVLAGVVETYRGTVAERTNDVMKVLTVFSATLLPLSVIAGIYGMNFEHMPELTRRWAYPAVLGLMAVVAIALWLYFVRRGFVSAPRARRIPRQVGRGLGQVAAPVRSLGNLALSAARAEARGDEGDGRRRGDALDVLVDLFELGWRTPREIFGEGDDHG